MTISEFQCSCKESMGTIRGWLEQGYIPGAVKDIETDEWRIPAHARPPYTKARAKTAQSICVSIVDASNKRRHVFPALYQLDSTEFESYIDALVNAGLICRRTVDEVTYYDATLKGQEYTSQGKNKLRKLVMDCLSASIEAAAKGSASAMMEYCFGRAG